MRIVLLFRGCFENRQIDNADAYQAAELGERQYALAQESVEVATHCVSVFGRHETRLSVAPCSARARRWPISANPKLVRIIMAIAYR